MEGECNEGFENWGGLQFDGSKIYGHQGDGCNDFGVYSLGSNSWSDLPFVPEVEEEGAVLGSALNPVTNTYLTYGPYEGDNLFRYDIEGNSWTTSLLPFAEEEPVDDGGMAYVSIAGIEGVYIVQGENGDEFLRYNEKNVTDLSPSISASVVKTTKGGEVTYALQVKNNGPERASGVTLSDTLPSGQSLLSAATSQGSCSGTTAVSCAIGVLKSGAGASVTLKVSATPGTVTNSGTVSSQATDSNSGNDSATATVTIPKPCTVPKLKGKKVKRAKKALRAAHCKPGKVTRRYSRKVKKGRVVRAGRHRGTVLLAGQGQAVGLPRRQAPGSPQVEGCSLDTKSNRSVLSPIRSPSALCRASGSGVSPGRCRAFLPGWDGRRCRASRRRRRGDFHCAVETIGCRRSHDACRAVGALRRALYCCHAQDQHLPR